MWKRSDYKYCSHCGTELIECGHHTAYYNQLTGKPVTRYMLRCPAYVLWQGEHFKELFDGEDMYVVRWD